MIEQDLLAQGARSLLLDCAQLHTGDKVLIVAEDPALGWYDTQAPAAVLAEAKKLGMETGILAVGAPENHRCSSLAERMAVHDCTVFFSRKGDQDRFATLASDSKVVMCYARDARMLSSLFCRAPHQGFLALKDAINQILIHSEHVHITCPLGTDYRGRIADFVRREKADVSVRRFPVGVPMPISSEGFSGKIAVADYLTPTGSKVYTPATLALEKTVYADVVNTTIQGFSGDADTVARIQRHYSTVARQLQIDPYVIHSWHAGLHPCCAYPGSARKDPDLWSNTVFCNPRFLHFHTCGDYAPGEIALMVKNPTIEIDGRKLWNCGRLCPQVFEPTADCLQRWPQMQECFEHPADELGLDFSLLP